MRKKYIEVDLACAEIDKGDLLVGNNAEWAKECIRRTPTADVVEVVRCGKCKFWENEGYKGRCNGIKNGLVYELTDFDDFCSYGEKEDG